MSKDRLPLWIERYLEKWLDPELHTGIFGDLLEQYHHDKQTDGIWRAKIRLVYNVLVLTWYRGRFTENKLTTSVHLISSIMLFNHVKVSLRSLGKHWGYTSINIVGLTLGFACCLLIGLFVQEELSYDRYHEKANRIYRLAAHVQGASYENGIAKISAPWGPEAQTILPEVERSCRFVFYGQTLISNGRDSFYENGGLWVDSTVFDIFSWPFNYGDPSAALSAVNSVVLTQELAQKYFPNENPIGQILTFDNNQEMVVSGVIEDIPDNSHFTFRYLVPLHGYNPPDHGDIWTRWNQYYTYLLLKEEASVSSVGDKIDEMLALHLSTEDAEAYTPLLQPIQGIHLHSKLHREMSPNSDISYIYIFSIVALLTLLIALTNFINLFTARATHRTKEIGVRKVIGANRKSLFGQFIVEALLVSFLSGMMAIALSYIFLPFLNSVLNKTLALNLVENFWMSLGLFCLILVAGFLSGVYPGLVLSSLKAVHVLKPDAADSFLRSFSGKGHRALFRKGLIILQFAIASFLIIAALVVNDQLRFIQQKNLGFNKDQIINIPMSSPGTLAKARTLKHGLLQIPGVEQVSMSANKPGGSDYGVPYEAIGLEQNEQPPMRCLVVDEDFLTTYEMELAMGREFSSDMPTDSSAYLINETAAKQLGWDNPLGQLLAMPAVDREPAPIIGVVKDFHFHSLHEPIGPLYFFMENTWYSQVNVKLDASRMDETLAAIEAKWNEFEPDLPFRYTFFDEGFASLHAAEASTARLIKWFTYLAILITCLGLFGLSAFMADRRTKEIGIRKVFGASMVDILRILTSEILILVLIALLIAIPIAYSVSTHWLENFAYTIDFGLGYIVFSIILAGGIAVLTVSYHVFQSALKTPISALKYE
ncbi:MAG: ABC transporter permease [Bacteroidota bacterium]